MIDREYIINQTQQYDVITFDVFDTLIIRDVRIPTDIFSLSYGIIGRYIRVAAEIVARHKSKTGEVTLDDISKICPFSCEKELEFEKMYCRANPVMLDVYKELVMEGKKLYAISDMYLSSDFISSLLNSSGFDIPVLVSCEEHCSKKDGTLFKRFMEINSISPEKMIHIGDNYESDGEGAKKAGIKSLIIEKHSDMLSYTDYSISDPELSSFINHGLNELSDPMEKIGYEVVGPIILSFCQWIHKKKNEYRFDRLYFLARDMRFTFETYKSLYPCDESRYLCVSRKSLIKAKEKPGEFCEYLNKQGCCGNVSIVDTGWVGGMQLTIEKYACKLDENTDLGGLYLGAKLAFRNLKRSKRSAVCLYPSWMGQFKCQLFPPFMETLIGCNEKQVVDYAYGDPIFYRDESMD